MGAADDITVLVNERRRTLEALSFGELERLEEFQTVAESRSGVQVTIARKSNPDGSITIIVEGWEPQLLGLGQKVTSCGFNVAATGECRELREEEYW
jgi:hypothetical protein